MALLASQHILFWPKAFTGRIVVTNPSFGDSHSGDGEGNGEGHGAWGDENGGSVGANFHETGGGRSYGWGHGIGLNMMGRRVGNGGSRWV
jgi:hypothetical protein